MRDIILTIMTRFYFAFIICVVCSINSLLLRGRLRKQPVTSVRSVTIAHDVESVTVTTQELHDEDILSKFIKGCIDSPVHGDGNNVHVHTTKQQGKQLLQSLKLPHRKDEAWRHTNLKKLFSHEFQPAPPRPPLAPQSQHVHNLITSLIDAQCTKSCIVFIDGDYSAQHSCMDDIPEKITAGSIRHKHDAAVLQHINSGITQWVPDLHEHPRNSFGSDFLSALHKAGTSDMACIVLSPGEVVEVPIQVLFCNTVAMQHAVGASDECSRADNDANVGTNTAAGTYDSTNEAARVSYPSLVVHLGDGAVLRLKQSYHTITARAASSAVMQNSSSSNSNSDEQDHPENSPGMVAAGTNIWLGEGAALIHTYVQEVAGGIRHMDVVTANLSQRNSRYDATVLLCGGKVSRVNVHVSILSETSNCTLNGITLAGTGQSLDLHSSILHNSTSGISRQQQRNVIADKGEAIFKGRIRIPKQAQLTDSDQLCRSIMLGSRARLQVMPTLEISADNVVCSHGASVVDLDENSMFYLASRGIDRPEARKLLLMGFVFDLLKGRIMDDRGAKRIVEKVQSLYPRKETVRAEEAPSAQKYMSI